MQIPVIVNPKAGRGRAGSDARSLRSLLHAGQIEHDIVESQCRGDIEEQVLLRISDGADRIIIAGGDGSIHEAVNGAMRAGKNAAFGETGQSGATARINTPSTSALPAQADIELESIERSASDPKRSSAKC